MLLDDGRDLPADYEPGKGFGDWLDAASDAADEDQGEPDVTARGAKRG